MKDNNMKKTSIIAIAALAGLLVAGSCSKNTPPVFDDSKAFVGFSNTSYSVDEAWPTESGEFTVMGDTVRIPVSLASVKGLEGSVKFTVVPDSTTLADGTRGVPEEGTHYVVVSEGGTLKFDAENRIQYIAIAGKYYDKYTGDFSVTVKLESVGNLPLGALDECKVVIADVDHPLAAILGSYSVSSTGATSGQNPFAMTIKKDAQDDHKVWIDNIFGNSGWGGSDTMVYGNVDDDLTKITVPFGQKVEYKYSGADVILLGIASDNETVLESGNCVIGIVKDASGNVTGLTFSDDAGEPCGTYLYIVGLGGASYAEPVLTATKN